MIACYATQRHYLEHLAPIAAAAELEVYISGGLRRYAPGARAGLPPREDRDPVVVASYRDAVVVRQHSGRPIVFVEHGAGQDYGNGTPAHPGGTDRSDVVLFLCPNSSVAERNRAVYPNAEIAVVGCPKLDPWHAGRRTLANRADPVIALAWHWDCLIVPEARSAFRHYAEVLPALARAYPGRVLGHAHPRILNDIAPAYARAGIEVVWELAEVLDRADVLAFDITSAGYEFASLGRPVLALNAPWYRRHVYHGLRFWDLIPGPQVDGPAGLLPGIERALADLEEDRALRESVSATVYAARDGRAAERAAEAISALG
jgi:hypothetical protein